MAKVNYHLQLEETIKQMETTGTTPTLLLHSCCAPCSSYILEYLSQYFAITVFYYNPNIAPKAEFQFRSQEQQRLIGELPQKHPITYIEGTYDSERFYALAKGLENEPEGGERCRRCFQLRLEEAALLAQKGDFDFFTTTLSISPHKNASVLNGIGETLSKEYGVSYLYSDFKKKNGYRRSCELSQLYDMYRQDYCGCVFSKAESEARKQLSTPNE
ncbi:epoxyqueuosine reductase QueH [Chakrabartyella piscis]|uniref:epoxyqueuosine reductase QueH n=1 Tax=Chakrabartyella piscis TaxID=2918914 RepID=UPI0029587C6A|nr:epoxyqueuosine reductase QueH [Chakrabartyella piscis]